ncbi:HAMP domain-containing histidine kinase [Microbispora sp. RL4-1S]|uniref:histidine kinase n=1 Tax=Microbispora oryzae TaxID=2806554 RepID=A0A940WHI8_9ACTN|nr:HAMP domain-containing sensor histidine kinase [Microbispora oryzae]MBP2704117.1 HAMP domain-containing histidine kinase [Microbispora oryzae]
MLLPRLRSLSLRARLALIAIGAAVFVLAPLVVAVNVVVRHAVADRIWDETLDVATRVAGQVRGGTVSDPLSPGRDDVDLIEVVGPKGRVLAASPAAGKLHRLTLMSPTAAAGVTQTTSCSLPHHDCVLVTALRVSIGGDSPTVYAGRTAPTILTSPLPELELFALALLFAAATGWVAWTVAGRVLRPVEAISSEFAEITAATSATRVSEPPGNDEIARLARTANDALSRLDRSIRLQRQFAADASHELLTPIAGIRAQLEGARLHPEDTDEAVDAALCGVDRLEAIVADLLLLARVGTTPQAAREDVDLGGLVAAEVGRRAKRLPMIVDAASGVTVRVLRGQLCRVVANLLDNAERHAQSHVSVEVNGDGDEAVLRVVNDGDPISEPDREHIFERFYRTDSARSRTHGGTGLGLAIAREVVEAHDGTITVENGDRSVRFVVRLPRSGEPGPGVAVPGVTVPEIRDTQCSDRRP